MSSDGITPTQRAFLATQQMTATFSDFSAHDLATMPMDEYARLTGRKLVIESAAPSQANLGQDSATVADVREPASVDYPGDFANLSMAEYAAVREQLGIGRGEYGRGALDGGSTADWVQAAQRKAGRSAWQGRNVVEPPRLERYVRQDDRRDTRSLAERFSDQSTAFSL